MDHPINFLKIVHLRNRWKDTVDNPGLDPRGAAVPEVVKTNQMLLLSVFKQNSKKMAEFSPKFYNQVAKWCEFQRWKVQSDDSGGFLECWKLLYGGVSTRKHTAGLPIQPRFEVACRTLHIKLEQVPGCQIPSSSAKCRGFQNDNVTRLGIFCRFAEQVGWNDWPWLYAWRQANHRKTIEIPSFWNCWASHQLRDPIRNGT